MSVATYDVLLVEDMLYDEQMARRALARCGLNVSLTVATDGVEALRILGLSGATDPFTPDLIICDFKLPMVSGDEVLRRVRECERLKDTPFILFSSSDDPKDIETCQRLGVTAYAVKPMDYQDYMTCVQHLAHRWLKGGEPPPCEVCRESSDTK